ncbi:MAG: response regulator [Myxococcota bacterium]
MSDDDKLSILVVDDDEIFRERLGRALKERGYEVRLAASASEAVALATEESPEAAVVDLRLPDGSGLDVVAALQRIDAATRIVVLTGYGSVPTAVEAMRLGAIDYLQKPAHAMDILQALEGKRDHAEEHALQKTPTLARAEWEYLHRVLADCEGNISEASRRLGIHRRSLQRKLQKHPPQK